jgi:DnaK suppressor protein
MSAMTDSVIRARLEAERTDATRRVDELEVAFAEMVAASQDVATDDEHDPEGHTIAFERQQLAALVKAARTQVDEVEAALERVNAGRYGQCEGCGARIADERLDALAETRFCIGCA